MGDAIEERGRATIFRRPLSELVRHSVVDYVYVGAYK